MNDGLNVTIGLFSFNGGTEPRRSWSCALPEEWGDNSESGGVKGYRVVFELTTGKLWLIASKTFRGAENGGGAKEFRWFFTGSISSEGELSPYDPAAEIPDWRVGNLKTLSVGRYGRVVTEYSNTSPKRRLSHRVFYPAAKWYREGAVTAWFDGGEERPLKDFYSSPDYDNFTASGNYKVDGKGNLYLEYAWYNQNNGTYAQRFAIFSPSD